MTAIKLENVRCPYCRSEDCGSDDEWAEGDVVTMWFGCAYCGNEWEQDIINEVRGSTSTAKSTGNTEGTGR